MWAKPDTRQNDERTPLQQNVILTPPNPTPLPRAQLSPLFLLIFAMSLMSASVIPYINELISELPITGGDERKAGYYSGIIISLYFVGEATTVLLWSRLSDFIGRKPVLLGGTLGSIIATVLFGLSRTFWELAASRFLAGALNGNAGVLPSMLVEVTDESNIARSMSLLILAWSVSFGIGSFVGGRLSRPHDHWPGAFRNTFWVKYPYFLPCAVTSAFAIVSLLIVSIFLKETLHKRNNTSKPRFYSGDSNAGYLRDGESNIEDENNAIVFPGMVQQRSSLRALLTRPVLLSISINALFAFLEISNNSLVPLVYTTPIRYGGLGLDPAQMGTFLGVFGILNGAFQFAIFPRIMKLMGLRGSLLASMSCLVPAFLLFPINGTADNILWFLVLLHMLIMVGINMAYSCIFLYTSSAAPKGMLGATNGLAQTVASVQRFVGPTIASSIFAFSLEKEILGGYGAFYALTLCTFAVICFASQFPREAWKSQEDLE
ncbi:MFS general substrate transporter [Multifurca ochricompacta]|uniref:MFS general substrate transporter n=1 Tax=Multifurca ochricompacta TaxID=376703 RepID=A0AAD4M0Q3_9AGAM|nr:MFS general substrate transporter [Multifurca ochricompacta]